jgi:biopolymer transport protein ExbD
MRISGYQPKRARVEIVPMIDTIFFLLVFFMMASLAMTTAKGMPVNLPRASTSTERPLVKIVLTLTRAGRYYVDKQPVVFEQVFPILKNRLKDNPKAVVVINCDRFQPWDKGIQLADEAKRAGARYLTIATEPKYATASSM